MKQSVLRRCAAVVILLSFCALTGACAFADGGEEKINSVRIAAPASVSESMQLTGPDVDEDGSVCLQEGKRVSFTLESPVTMDTSGMYPFEGGMWQGAAFFDLVSVEQQVAFYSNRWLLLSSDESGMLAGLPDNAAGTLRIAFENVQLLAVDQIEDTGELFFTMDGTCQIEVRFPVTRTVQRPPFENTQSYREETSSLLQSAPVQQQPYSEAVFRATMQGQMGSARNSSFPADAFYYAFSTVHSLEGKTWNAELEYDGRIQKIEAGEDLPWGYEVDVLLNITDWGHVSTGGGSVVATAAGATALGLGGTAVANALSQPDALPARREGLDGDLPEEEGSGEPPELPREDSPNVSLSLYKPFGDLVNTKGAALDVQITLSGGEGLSWHFLPTAICPGGLRAVIPTVVGTGSDRMLVLALTGAPMKQAHCPVFVTVVAWAMDTDGQLLKTSATMELTLHRGGLEAKRQPDGKLEVVSYSDGNLDGLAEKRVLKDREYTLCTEADGSVTVQANEKRLGSCTLPPEGNN